MIFKFGLIMGTIAMLASGCSVFGIRSAEELQYDIIKKDGPIEIRNYKPYISAEATKEGIYGEVQGDLFRILAGYIFGKNSKNQKIAMTAPVKTQPTQEVESEKIAMTAPVFMKSASENKWTMAFSMPSKYNIENLPKPLSPEVKLREVKEKTFAVIRFSGSYDNLDKRMKKASRLNSWIQESGTFKATSKPVFAGYDPPFTLPFLRRNEVFVEVESIQ